MIFFLVSFLSFFLLTKPPLLKLLPSWVSEMRLLMVLLCQEAIYHSFQYGLMTSRLVLTKILKNPFTMCSSSRIENVEEEVTMTVLELPELALDLILAKLSPSSLCGMSSVCTYLRDRCMSDHLWERHMKEKWGRIIGKAAEKEWELYVGRSRKKSRRTNGNSRSVLPIESVMARYLALETGRFWFPAQVYNREVLMDRTT